MSILTASGLAQSLGATDVFTGISAGIPHAAKIGLVGPNGIGKTTLLRLLAGLDPPTRGTVHLAQGTRIGYLRQEAVEAFAGRTHTVYDEMLTDIAPVLAQAAALAALEAQMAAGDYSDTLLDTYGTLQEAFERGGGYEYEIRIRQVLEGVGFPSAQWALPLGHLSGGQKTRALLARLLLEAPDLLILDEPTNHLDVAAVEWLEHILRTWPGALLVVSHDRYFLDTVVDRIWELSRTGIEVYRGNYSAYVQQRQERWDHQQQVYEVERERMEKELDFIRQHLGTARNDIAVGKLRRLGRLLVAIEYLGLIGALSTRWLDTGLSSPNLLTPDEVSRRIKALKPPATRPPTINMRLQPEQRGGNIILRTTNLLIGYPATPLFTADPLTLTRRECAALIGPNGSGKTTFLRTLLGQIAPLAGTVQLGATLKVGYFAQTHDALNPTHRVIDALLAHREMPIAAARTYLAQYLFRGDEVWNPVGGLSGGERGRLALAILALDGANLLLLDEPTNHLDLPAQEVLQAGLEQFEGTLLLVSHDRYLVDRLATQVWELRDGRLHVFQGTYQAFLAARRSRTRERGTAVPALPVGATPARRRA
jgi:ATP-binding cassette subfamily F protein 3